MLNKNKINFKMIENVEKNEECELKMKMSCSIKKPLKIVA